MTKFKISKFFGTAHIVCKAGYMKWYGVHPPVHLSIPAWATAANITEGL